MSRMPMHVLYSFRYAFRASVFAVAIAIFSLFSPAAHADPHAVFYTDRAQEQLFFNTLAALNQADFVEPGIAGQPFSRAGLVDLRTQEARNTQSPAATPVSAPGQSTAPVDFTGYENPLVASTKTNLPGVVSRNITLEGNDLWTAYLVNQLALETKTRRSVSELVRKYCTAGFGREGCSTLPGTAQQQSTAFINDIATYNPATQALLGGLSDGAPGEKDFRDEIAGTKKLGNPSFQIGTSGPAHPGPNFIPESLKVPRPSFPDIENLRVNNEDSPEKLGLVNGVIAGVMSTFFPSNVDSDALQHITLKKDGEVELSDDISSEDYLKTLSGLGSILHGSIDNAMIALEEGEAAKNNREDTRSLADTILTKDSSGALKAIIKTPSSAKEAAIQSQADVIASATVNQKSVAPQELTNPGTTSLIPDQQINKRVLGASTNDSTDQASNGRVAGILTQIYDAYYNRPEQSTIDINTGSRPPYEEGGLYEGLQTLTGDIDLRQDPNAPETACGFCTSLNTILGVGTAASQSTLNVIQGVYNDIYCTFRPSDDPVCIKKQVP